MSAGIKRATDKMRLCTWKTKNKHYIWYLPIAKNTKWWYIQNRHKEYVCFRYFTEICTKEGIKAVTMENYFIVSPLIDYFDSNVSYGGESYRSFSRKKTDVEFGKLFRKACDELKEQSDPTHQKEGYEIFR